MYRKQRERVCFLNASLVSVKSKRGAAMNMCTVEGCVAFYLQVWPHEQLLFLPPHSLSPPPPALIPLIFIPFPAPLFAATLLPSRSSSTPHRAPTTSNSIMSRPCLNVHVSVSMPLCVFLPAGIIQQLQWPLSSSANQKKKKRVDLKSRCDPMAGVH